METEIKSRDAQAESNEPYNFYRDPNRSEALKELQIVLGLWDGNPNSPVKRRDLPPRTWVPNDRWRALEGILSDLPDHDTSQMKERNRAEEEEHNARKFGRSTDQ